MAKTTIYKGSESEVQVEVYADDESFKISDATTTFKVEFYVLKKQSQGSYIIDSVEDKDKKIFFEDDENTFTAHVPTEWTEGEEGSEESKSLPTGDLCCTITGKYLDSEHSTEDNQIYLDFVVAINCNATIVEKYL